MTILEWAKANSKEGTNFAELEELAEQGNPLNKVKSVADAEVFIKENDLLKSAFDSSVSKAVKNHDDKFMADKFPGMLKDEREKIRAELNPKETDEQKQLREIKEELAEEKKLRVGESLKSSLRKKASELKVSEDIADSFVVYGDNAMDKLEAMAEYMTKTVEDGIAEGVKAKYKGRVAPEGGKKPANAKVVGRSDYDVMTPDVQSKFVADGGYVEDK